MQAHYEAAAAEAGYLMNYNRAWALRQDVTEHFLAARKLVAGTTTLSPGEIAVINAAVAGARKDRPARSPGAPSSRSRPMRPRPRRCWPESRMG